MIDFIYFIVVPVFGSHLALAWIGWFVWPVHQLSLWEKIQWWGIPWMCLRLGDVAFDREYPPFRR